MQDLGCKYLLILFLHYLTPFLSFSFVGLYIDNFLMLNDFSTAVIVSSGQVLWVDFGLGPLRQSSITFIECVFQDLAELFTKNLIDRGYNSLLVYVPLSCEIVWAFNENALSCYFFSIVLGCCPVPLNHNWAKRLP